MTWNPAELKHQRRKIREQLSEDHELHDVACEFLQRSYRRDYCYQWDWLGFPTLNMPEDIVAIQEIMFRNKPTVVVETGVAWGGGVALVASLMSLYAPTGRVLGVDKHLDPTLDERLSAVGLPVEIQLLEDDSTALGALEWVADRIRPDDAVMVILDSDHSHDHVLSELQLYGKIVSPGQFLVVCDTSVRLLADSTDRQRPWSRSRNPDSALGEFLAATSLYERDEETNQKLLTSFHPGGYLRRLASEK
jgi:cephalosporin hydroxylase